MTEPYPLTDSSGSRHVSQDDSALGRTGVVITDEAFRLRGSEKTEIVSPAKADGLIHKLHVQIEWPLRVAQRQVVAYNVAGVREVRVIRGIPSHRYVFFGILFLKAGRQQADCP